MAGSPEQPQHAPTIARFARGSRLAHWALAAPFVVLLLSGGLLFIPEVKAVHLGGQRLLPLVHVCAGCVLLALGPVVWLMAPNRPQLKSDLRQLFTPERRDAAWLRYAGYSLLGARLPQPATGKFNAGQKLNTLATAIYTGVLLASGGVLGVNYVTKAVFDARFVERVYPYHDAFTVIAIPLIAGHLYLALVNRSTRPSLSGILGGRVNIHWARQHHALWVQESEAMPCPAATDIPPHPL